MSLFQFFQLDGFILFVVFFQVKSQLPAYGFGVYSCFNLFLPLANIVSTVSST
jgi:hypothetical protein